MESLSSFEKRKKDHIRWSLSQKTQNLSSNGFEQFSLHHCALPDFNFSEVSLKTNLLNQTFSSPHFISSMTAGHKKGDEINQLLAKAAAEMGWLFCVGSQKKELQNKQSSKSWEKIVKNHPQVKFVSNIGIEEVIQYPINQILDLTRPINSIGIIVHLNPLQEVFQNKTDVYMKGSLKAITELVKKSSVPVIVKEVGFGISQDVSQSLFDVGVSVVDVSGSGGTHWGMVEVLRNPKNRLLLNAIKHFEKWGYSTAQSLVENNKHVVNRKKIWASGGIRSGVDSAKCLALGAQAVGIAQPLLKALCGQSETKMNYKKLIECMQQFDFELKTAMFCTGLQSIQDFKKREILYGRN